MIQKEKNLQMILLKENKKHQENKKIPQNAISRYNYLHIISVSMLIFSCTYMQKELERLRKESSTLLAKERAHVNELLRQQETEKEMIGSFKLKVKWKTNELYNKDNLKTIFSKVFYSNLILKYFI